MFHKIKHRYERWKDWSEYAKGKKGYGPIKRFLIFLGIIYDGWFEGFINWGNRKDD